MKPAGEIAAGATHMLSFTGGLRAGRLRSRRMMVALSHLIEEQAALAGPQTVLIATFQRFSLFQAELPRYREIAPRLAAIFVVGVADIALPELPNTTVIPIEPDWPLAQEWAVVASGPSCCMGLLARDAEGFRLDRKSRSFDGQWTTDPSIIDPCVDALHTAIGRPQRPFVRDTRAILRSTQALQRALATRRLS